MLLFTFSGVFKAVAPRSSCLFSKQLIITDTSFTKRNNDQVLRYNIITV